MRCTLGALQLRHLIIHLQRSVRHPRAWYRRRLTLAIVKYSTTTDAQFIARFTRMAVSVDMPSIIPMKKGPRSLQTRSIRLICEFIAKKRSA